MVSQPIINLLQGGSGETHVVKGLFRLAEDYVYTGKFKDFIKVRFIELIDKESLLIKILETNSRASIPILRSYGAIFIEPNTAILRKNDLVPVYEVPGLSDLSLS
jgi:molybdopterin biosynthesis enzyme